MAALLKRLGELGLFGRQYVDQRVHVVATFEQQGR